ncbi:MAG: hypothetical protein IT430_13390 [Phycisphaerales bacterium]|nr:hypothetical protein [Phycisphaerales bacterium]
MDRFRQSFEFVRGRLADLKPLHKVLVGSGLLVFLMAMFIVAQYAGKSSMELVEVSPDSRDAVLTRFAAQGITATPAGNDFLVPRRQQMDALAIVGEVDKSAAGSSVLLGLIKEQPWYANRHQNKQQYYAALNQVLSDIIGRWTYVQKAEVILTPPEEGPGAIGRRASKPTASVSITPVGTGLTTEQVEGIAMFVSGSVAGLEPEGVTVINSRTGNPMRTPDENDRSNGAYMELQTRIDSYWRAKIEDNLRHIPGVIVQVNATVDASRERSNDVSYKKEGEGSVTPITLETESKTQSTEASSGGVAGVQPNTGQGISLSNSATPSNTTSESTSEFAPQTGVRETTREDPKGYARKINATVKIPRSYFQRIWEKRNPDATSPPNDAALKPIETDEIAKISQEVNVLIDTEATNAIDGSQSYIGTVVVNSYTDLQPIAALAPESNADAGFLGMPGDFVNLPWGSMGMALLAGLSLFMMFRLVRSTTSARDLPSAEELVGIPPSLTPSIDELIGEADESDPAIDAVELDDEELRTRTIMQQIGELVSHDATDATRVVNRWISSEE